jgi:hypothetical protein
VVSIIETKHLTPVAAYEPYLQNYAAKVWCVLNLTRGKREARRPAMLEEAIHPFLGEGGPKREHLEAVRGGLLRFFREAEIAGELDTALQLAPGEGQPKRGFQPKPDPRPQREAWDKARQALIEQLWQEVRTMPELGASPATVASLALGHARTLLRC